MKIRLSKKFVFLLSGALVLCGASGSAAVLIGTDKILGPSYKDINGLTCTTLQTQKMRRDGSIWIRKYVTSDQGGDGIARLKTALRVARAVQEKEKAGLVQVAMIDSAGPKDTAEMRGRAIAAQVVYIPDPSKMPTGAQTENYSAYYLDGAPSSNGHFYGMRVDLPLEDIEHLDAHLTDKADCFDPSLPEGGATAKASGHGAPAGGEKASGHGAAPATEGAHGKQAEGKQEEGKAEEVAATESGGFLSSITGMVFGAKEEAPAAGHDAASEGEEKASPAQTEAKADVSHASAPAEPAREPRTTAEGGKGWSKSDAADEIHSGTAAEGEGKPEPEAEAAQADAHSGANAADAAGAAWLEKFRAQQAAPAVDAAPPAD
ncbi:hypothetical protein JNB91_02945 [Rhizobium wenxiniae]|uniref:hypothetical protein n=1 Tax=Rhizobium wenxiniae TaxID=1737357 RepID=UPI001C6F1278|nr:hypothetical protein [Rhizobium wenxiniae]MBW9086791.1 hypothetical protein [Rhizobium wenxiniae]